MKLLKMPLLLAVVACAAQASAAPPSSRFRVELSGVGRDAQSESMKTVRLRDRKTGALLWSRQMYGPKIVWSTDRRAVAVDGTYELLVWREDFPIRTFQVPGARDYLMGCAWSPDKQRLLVRCGSSGAADAGWGSLFCLTLRHGKGNRYDFIAGGVTGMKWLSSQSASYIVMEIGDGTAQPKETRHFWRVK